MGCNLLTPAIDEEHTLESKLYRKIRRKIGRIFKKLTSGHYIDSMTSEGGSHLQSINKAGCWLIHTRS